MSGWRRGLGLAALVLLLIADPGVALAQADGDIASEVEQRRQRLEDFDPDSGGQSCAEGGGADLAFPEPREQGALSPATSQAYKKALQAYYDYRKAGYEHRLSVFAWQAWSTKVIFFVVLVLVLAGIYFPAIQFHAGLRRRKGADPALGGDRGQPVAARGQGALADARRDHLDHLAGVLLSVPRSRLSDQERLLIAGAPGRGSAGALLVPSAGAKTKAKGTEPEMPASLLARAASIADLKKRARRRMPRFAFDYLEGGCNQEVALARNRSALDAIVMEPRYLEDCAEPDLSVSLFGRRYDAPFGVAPVGLGGLMWPRVAEILAEAAGRANIPFCLSTVGTTSIERAAELARDCFWFQLYTPIDAAVRDSLLDRAAAVGCRVLLVTIDVPVAGWRPRDLRNGLSVPPRLDLRTILQIAARPVWALAMLRAGIPRFETMRPYMAGESNMTAASAFIRRTLTGGLNREVLARIRDRWRGALVLKGIETERDAELALQLGADGVVVSNHGGRQLDASRSPVEVLPQICAAVGTRMPVLADSGVESGADIARMLAKGAQGLLVGRAFIYGVGALGHAGGEHTIELLRDELARFMGQLRCSRPEELARHLPANENSYANEQPLRAHAVA